MRTLRWASELAVAEDDRTALVGVTALEALNASPWLQAEDEAFIDAVLAALVGDEAADYRRHEHPEVVNVEYPTETGAGVRPGAHEEVES